MKKIALNLLSLVVLGAVALPVMALAQIGGNPPAISLNLTTLGNRIANAVWIIFTAIAVIMFVVAGIMFLTAQGEPEKIQKARSSLIWGVAGIVVAVIAFTIITLVVRVVNSGT